MYRASALYTLYAAFTYFLNIYYNDESVCNLIPLYRYNRRPPVRNNQVKINAIIKTCVTALNRELRENYFWSLNITRDGDDIITGMYATSNGGYEASMYDVYARRYKLSASNHLSLGDGAINTVTDRMDKGKGRIHTSHTYQNVVLHAPNRYGQMYDVRNNMEFTAIFPGETGIRFAFTYNGY